MTNKRIFLINMIYFVAITLVATVFALGYAGIITNEWISSFLIQIVVIATIPLLLHGLLISKGFKKTFKDIGFNKISFKMVGWSVLLGVVLYILNSFVAAFSQSIIALFGFESLTSSVEVNVTYGKLFKEILLSCILPAICEEILHRGILLFSGKEAGSSRYCLIFSSLLFGLTHLNINQFFYASILGFLMGYVVLVSNSIFPAMIIHFMNNFLSTYLFYGEKLGLPIASALAYVENLLYSSIFGFVFATSCAVYLCIILYRVITRKMIMERIKSSMQQVVDNLNLTHPTMEEAQEKLTHINEICASSDSAKYIVYSRKGVKFSFTDNLFLYSSLILGGLITIMSFIWGVL